MVSFWVWGTCPIKVRILASASCRSIRLEPRAGILGAAVALSALVGLGKARHISVMKGKSGTPKVWTQRQGERMMARWMGEMRQIEARELGGRERGLSVHELTLFSLSDPFAAGFLFSGPILCASFVALSTLDQAIKTTYFNRT